jgi:hypothetical protein
VGQHRGLDRVEHSAIIDAVMAGDHAFFHTR